MGGPVRGAQFEPVTARVPESVDADPGPQIVEFTAADYCDRAPRRQPLERGRGPVHEGGGPGCGHDLRQGAVEIQEYRDLLGIEQIADAHPRCQRVRYLRHAPESDPQGHLGEIVHDDVGAAVTQSLRVIAAVHADHQPESARPPGGDPGLGVLDHHRAARLRAQPPGSLEQHVRIGFARQPEFLGDDAVHAHREQVPDTGRPQHLGAIAARREHRHPDARRLQPANQRDGRGEGGHAVAVEPLLEQAVLPVAQRTHGTGVLGIAGIAPRQRNTAGGKEIGDPAITRLPVHRPQIVRGGERCVILPRRLRPRRQEPIEHLRPRGGMHRRAIGDDTVHIQDDGVVMARIDHRHSPFALGHESKGGHR